MVESLKKRSKENNKTALKSGFWYTLSNFVTRAVVFITTPIFARLLTTDEFGDFHIYANWQSIFLIICSMEFSLTINRARLDYDNRQIKNYIGNLLIANGIVTIVFFLLIILNEWICSKLLILDKKYVCIMFLYLLFYPAFELFQSEQRVKYNYKLSAFLSFFSVCTGACLAVSGAFVFDDKLFGRIVGQYSPAILLGIVFWIFYIFHITEMNYKYCKYALKIAIPLIFSYLGSQILSSSDKIVVQHMSSAEAVAFIGIVASCSHIMVILIQSLNNAWAPWLYDKLEGKEYIFIQKAFKVYFLFIGICTFEIILLGPELIQILGGEKYAEAVKLIPPSISFCIFNLIIFQFVNIEIYYKKNKFAAYAMGVAAILNIGFDIIFVNIFGYIAVSFITLICYAILMYLHAWYVNRIDKNKLIPNQYLILGLFYVVTMIILSYISYTNIWIRYLLVLILTCYGGFILLKALKETGVFAKG